MELQTAFETRRSIRHYDAEKKVTKEHQGSKSCTVMEKYTDFQILLCIIRGQGCRIQSKMSAGIQSEKFSRCRRVNRYNICKRTRWI